jgi:hypothetical protein
VARGQGEVGLGFAVETVRLGGRRLTIKDFAQLFETEIPH